jgi:dihydrodipicolinate synthase/N-acetylneuraminate lyase
MAINTVTPSLLERLCSQIPSLAGMKTSQRDAQVVRRLIDASPEYFTILAGNESVALGMLALGAHGLISGLSTAVPEPFIALTDAVAAGDLRAARRKQLLINQLLPVLPAGKRIGAIKWILAERGIAVGRAVPPRPMPTDSIWPKLKAILDGAA